MNTLLDDVVHLTYENRHAQVLEAACVGVAAKLHLQALDAHFFCERGRVKERAPAFAHRDDVFEGHVGEYHFAFAPDAAHVGGFKAHAAFGEELLPFVGALAGESCTVMFDFEQASVHLAAVNDVGQRVGVVPVDVSKMRIKLGHNVLLFSRLKYSKKGLFFYIISGIYELDLETRVKKILFVYLLLLALALSACIFDSDETVMADWLADQGVPGGYEVQTLSIDGLTPISSAVFMDSTPKLANDRAVLGRAANISHDIVFDIAFYDSVFFADLKNADSATAYLAMYVLRPFYSFKSYPTDSLPLKEDLALNISWSLDKGSSMAFVDSVGDISDSLWLARLAKWKAKSTVDTTISISVSAKDTIVKIALPSELLSAMKKLSKACHLQLKLSASEAARTYRFYGAGTSYYPKLWVVFPKEKSYSEYDPYRMAQIVSNKETCSDCAVLHGGVYDSLVLEYESAPIMKALSDFYGDDFPYTEGNGDDVRQTVILAQLTFARDDSQGSSELGLPIQVVVGSYTDSSGKSVRQMESYRLNKSLIATKGHPNMVFYDGDSLTLQVTYGMRDFINRARDGRNFKMMMRMGYPVLLPKDSTYSDRITSKKDTSYVFFSHFDHSRYDFTSSLKQPATMKLWLANKRGNE